MTLQFKSPLRVHPLLSSDIANVTLTPQFGNQLGGTPILVEGLSLQPNDAIQCIFDGRANFGKYVNANTALCITPVMATLGIVKVFIRVQRFRQRLESEAVFTSVGVIAIGNCN